MGGVVLLGLGWEKTINKFDRLGLSINATHVYPIESEPYMNGSCANLSHGSYGNRTGNRKRSFCYHCCKLGHLKDTWKIHGKRTDWKPRQNKT